MSPRPAAADAPATPPGIFASVLTADFARLGAQVGALAAAGVDGIHWDIMDANAVPALSFGPQVVAACRPAAPIPFQAHVMSAVPALFIADLARAGCQSVIVHPDWVRDPRRVMQAIVDAGMTAGVALSPGTPATFARWHLDIAEIVLVMTVEPGYGGQPHLGAMQDKVRAVARMADDAPHPVTVAVDGGIAPETIAPMLRAGASLFVVGSALWRARKFEHAIDALRAACARPMPPAHGQSRAKTAEEG